MQEQTLAYGNGPADFAERFYLGNNYCVYYRLFHHHMRYGSIIFFIFLIIMHKIMDRSWLLFLLKIKLVYSVPVLILYDIGRTFAVMEHLWGLQFTWVQLNNFLCEEVTFGQVALMVFPCIITPAAVIRQINILILLSCSCKEG